MSDNILPSSPDDQKKLQGMIKEMAICLQNMDDQREHLNDIAKLAKEKFEIDPKLTRKLAKALHKHNFADLRAEHEELELLYETLIEGRKGGSSA